jgi:guanylate kinase
MNKLFCLLGPSGTGKDTIKRKINVPHIVSYRTREIREGETNGVDGKFISEEEYDKMDSKNLFIAKTIYSGNKYGITREELKPLKYTDMLYVVDWKGVETLRGFFEEDKEFSLNQIVTIYVDSPYESLTRRMRMQERTFEEIEMRVNQYWEVDYPTKDKCDYVVYNAEGKLDKTVLKIKEIMNEIKLKQTV